jgi:hypothetical protein
MMRLLDLADANAPVVPGMSNSRIHWIRILLGGLFAEVALIIAIVPLGLHLGGNFLLYTAPPGSFLTCFFAALWVGAGSNRVSFCMGRWWERSRL